MPIETIAQILASAREDAGLSQSAAARSCGVARQAIHRGERGLLVQSLDHVAALARAYGLTPAELVARVYPEA